MPDPTPSTHPRQRARGALLGLAVGDALGTTLEFTQPAPAPFSTLREGPHTGITGGGPFNLARGQVTDDTQMAVCLGSSLARLGYYDAEELAGRYRAWVKVAFDVGSLTRAAIAEMEVKTHPVEQSGYRVWQRGGRTAAGNGSLMRTAPIAVFYAGPEDAAVRRTVSLGDSSLTHADPRCQLACASFNAALAAAIQGRGSTEEVVRAAEEELPEAAAEVVQAWPDAEAETRAAVSALQSDLRAARAEDPQLYGPQLHLHQSQGFVRAAFRLAFWELLHAPSAAAGLVDVVNRGGDADTNGAIAGALLGAFHGEESLPRAWRDAVLGAMREVDQSPWWTLYHPRLLLPLADWLPDDGPLVS